MQRFPDQSALIPILDVAMSVDEAVCGDILRFNEQADSLEVLVWRGYDDAALAHFRVTPVDQSTSSGQALLEGRRVVIRDVTLDAAYAPHRDVASTCGWRAVQSTPLRSLSGKRIGVLSTHFAKPHHPSKRSAAQLEHCCGAAALLLECIETQARFVAIGKNIRLMRRAAGAVEALPALLAVLGGRYDALALDALARELTHIARFLAAYEDDAFSRGEAARGTRGTASPADGSRSAETRT